MNSEATIARPAGFFLPVDEQLVRAIAEGRGDDADALARTHGAIDFEHITTAMRRAGVLAD
jgi:GntR family transcriptional regulator, transcriptional repressor for pyruvate dehydrogenase complex